MSKREELIQELQRLAIAERAAHALKKVPTFQFDADSSSPVTFISVERDHDVRSWAALIGCSEHDVREAIKAVGNSADEVQRYLSYRKP